MGVFGIFKKMEDKINKCLDKTKCLSCETIYYKKIFLFDYCPNCKGKKLIKYEECLEK
tara:strand:+ start:32 stop:205 length:174 start_codon:yes stop_codon:yes gene_type:complete